MPLIMVTLQTSDGPVYVAASAIKTIKGDKDGKSVVTTDKDTFRVDEPARTLVNRLNTEPAKI